MNILFLTLLDFNSLDEHNIYTDLLREFTKREHHVFVVSPVERRKNQDTEVVEEKNATILKLKIGNTQKTNIIEKGISTVRIEHQFISGIKRYFSNVKFDLVIYSTPPITFCKAIDFIKKRDDAETYLLLKDIFPQNAVDMGMMSKTGIKSILYKYFRNKEKRLYEISDRIGCMSQANVDYLIDQNPELDSTIVEVCPNSVEPIDMSVDEDARIVLREKYDIPFHKIVFVYGGNLGKPQGIEFLIDCLRSQKNNEDVFFLIVGDGTEFGKLESYVEVSKQDNLKLLKRLPKEDYDAMIGACDVGMIFLDHRFTIPNFPSRLLSYMQAKLPVFALTDNVTDVGNIILDGNFGWWCESNDVKKFDLIIKDQIMGEQNIIEHKENAFLELQKRYDVKDSYEIIMRHFNE